MKTKTRGFCPLVLLFYYLKKMKKTTLEFLGKNKTLYIVESEYCNNGHKYFGLYEKNGELFSDITTNFDFLDENEYAIDNDFINCCFDDNKALRKRINENFDITSQGVHNGQLVFTL